MSVAVSSRNPAKDQVAIASAATTGFTATNTSRSQLSYAAEACVAALRAAGLTAADVDGIIGSSNPAANQSIIDLAARVSAGRPGEVRVAFGTTDPRPATALDGLPEPIAVLPLFLADGLLLDPLRAMSAERGWSMIEPLGDRAAPIVLGQYDGARTSAGLR